MQAQDLGIRSKRHPLWGKEYALDEIRKFGSPVQVCKMHASPETCGWRGYYADLWRWKRSDPGFAKAYEAIVGDDNTGGRPRLDEEDSSWKEEYCRILLERAGNEDAARRLSGCPLSIRQLRERLSPASTTYDDAFAEKVSDVWAQILGEHQEAAFGSAREFVDLKNESDDRMRGVKIKEIEAKTRSSLRVMEKVDPERYGNRLNVKGGIEHRHTLEQRFLPKEERLALLWEDRKRFEQERKQLSAGDDPEVVDAEIVGGE